MSVSGILHEPTWLALLLILVLLGAVYLLTKLFRVTLGARLLIMVLAMIAVSIVYLPYNAQVTAIVLSTGFIVCFLLTFTLLAKR